jgi:hypothetical protein
MNVPNVPIDLAQALFLELQNAPYRQWVEARRLAPSASRSGQARQGLFRPDTLALPSSAHHPYDANFGASHAARKMNWRASRLQQSMTALPSPSV